MSKISKILMTCLLIVAMMVSSSISAFALSNEIDSTMEIEGLKITKEGNKEITKYKGIETIDKTEKNIRTITSKSSDGTVLEYVENLKTGKAKLYLNGKLIENYDMEEERAKVTREEKISEEDLKAIDEVVENSIKNKNFKMPEKIGKYKVSKKDNGSYEISEGIGILRSNTKVYPAGRVTDVYPEYTYRTVRTASRYSYYCNRYLSMKVKDSMHSYVETSKTIKSFSALSSLAVVAGIAKITFGNALGIFTGVIQVVNGVYILSEACDYYQHQEYKYYALRQGYVYDYTVNYCDVAVFSENGTGRISLCWDFDGENYTNQRWMHTSLARPFAEYTYDEVLDETVSIWEYNMQQFGQWIWGNSWQ